MSSHLSSNGHDLQPGDRVIDLEWPIDRTTPDGTLQSLGVFLQHLDPLPAIELTDTDVLGALPLLEADSSELGVIVRWRALEQRGLLEHIDDPESIAVAVLQHQLSITVRPLSQLRSVEGTLEAAEDNGMAYSEAIRPFVDDQVPTPPFDRINDWLGAWDYSVEYDPKTETVRVEHNDQSCAVFPDGSIVGEDQLRADIEALLEQMP